ncbi:SMC-Scp complex subunit ScpB [Candidatus Woesearchaeota archaeon]|nr:SMC-Scp complex subunit ScpB [Candidatus Woesearchaeota archaeon]
MDEELKGTLEAILFSAARKVELAELAKLCRKSEQDVLNVLTEWKVHLDSKPGSIALLQEGTGWKLTVRDQYTAVVKKVVSKTELPKSILQTLAVVAYKAPVLQSAVIKVRTNKGYEHLNYLEESAFITREKKGRTKLIRLAPKFFDYFSIDPSQLKKKFHSMGDVEHAIEAKEQEHEQTVTDQQAEARHNLETPQIKIHGKVLETYPVIEPIAEVTPSGVEVFMEKLGELDVYDLPGKHKKLEYDGKQEHHAHMKHISETDVEQVTPASVVVLEEPEQTPEQKIHDEVRAKTKKVKSRPFESKGLYPEGVSPEMEKRVDARVKEIVEGEHPEHKDSKDEQ